MRVAFSLCVWVEKCFQLFLQGMEMKEETYYSNRELVEKIKYMFGLEA